MKIFYFFFDENLFKIPLKNEPMPSRIGTLQEGQMGKSFGVRQSVLETSFALPH